jgi:hypothetical protein
MRQPDALSQPPSIFVVVLLVIEKTLPIAHLLRFAHFAHKMVAVTKTSCYLQCI